MDGHRQFNEIWPTGGWGSIEYGTPRKGQVIGGRWKPLQYWYKSSIYTDVMATCGADSKCIVRNDHFQPFSGTVTVSAVDVTTDAVSVEKQLAVNLAGGLGVAQRL